MKNERDKRKGLLEKLFSKANRIASRGKLWNCASVGSGPEILGKVWIHGTGAVRLGDGVTIDGRICPVELHTFSEGEIVLGNGVVIEAGTSIEARESVVVGDRCHIGSYCKIIDNHLHLTKGNRHKKPPSKPVVLEEDVELGPMSVLLPGAYIEQGMRITPGKIISRRVKGAKKPEEPRKDG